MKKKLYILISLIILVVIVRLIYLCIYKSNEYKNILKSKTDIIVYGEDAPRGRILDINGNVLVDNIKINNIYFHNSKSITNDDKKKICKYLAKYLKDIKITENKLKDYYMFLNKDKTNNLITEEEYRLYEERKISKEELYNLKISRISLNDIRNINPKEAYIYYLLNYDYDFNNKLILEDLSDEDFAVIIEKDLPGIFGDYSWKRYYPYEDTLGSILGTVGNIPNEDIDIFLKNGYQMNDKVGISYLEKQYESYLRGSKAKYEISKNNELILVDEAKKGNDLVLSIDIETQLKLENIIKENILKAKKEANTKFYRESYAIVSNPSNGSIIAMSGKRLIKDNEFMDVTSNIINTSYTMGSVVKGATISVGYQNNIIDIGTKMKDACIKLYNVPTKCSFKRLGTIDDKTALMNSSNYYQFKIAIGLTGDEYKSNMKLNVSNDHFDVYRNALEEFGLGAITGIDLPNETTGIKGRTIAGDLLLNLAIGQYDTYTPIELMQYINTIASGGYKYKPSLMAKVINDDEVITNKYNYVSKLSLDDKYLNRIKEGLNLVLMKGTGRGYVRYDSNPAGKTGTSESFYDSDNDNINDVKTITKTFAGYFPSDNPKYSLVVISPNVSYDNPSNTYTSNVNRRITRSITDFLFEK